MSKPMFSTHENFDLIHVDGERNEHSFGVSLMLGLRDVLGPVGGGIAVVNVSFLPDASDDENVITKSKVISALEDATSCLFPSGIEDEDGGQFYINVASMSGIRKNEDGEITDVMVTIEGDGDTTVAHIDAFAEGAVMEDVQA